MCDRYEVLNGINTLCIAIVGQMAEANVAEGKGNVNINDDSMVVDSRKRNIKALKKDNHYKTLSRRFEDFILDNYDGKGIFDRDGISDDIVNCLKADPAKAKLIDLFVDEKNTVETVGKIKTAVKTAVTKLLKDRPEQMTLGNKQKYRKIKELNQIAVIIQHISAAFEVNEDTFTEDDVIGRYGFDSSYFAKAVELLMSSAGYLEEVKLPKTEKRRYTLDTSTDQDQ